MTDTDERTTDTANRDRTAPATLGKQKKAAKAAAIRALLKLDLVDDDTVVQLTELLVVTCMARGLRLRRPIDEP